MPYQATVEKPFFFFFFVGGADSGSFFLSRRCRVNCQWFRSLAPLVGVRYDWAGGDRNILRGGYGCAGGGSRHKQQRDCRFGSSPIRYHHSEIVPTPHPTRAPPCTNQLSGGAFISVTGNQGHKYHLKSACVRFLRMCAHHLGLYN